MDEQETIAADLLKGADEIADFLYGDPTRVKEVYRMSKKARKLLGLFHIDRTLHGTRSRIREGVAKMQEAGK